MDLLKRSLGYVVVPALVAMALGEARPEPAPTRVFPEADWERASPESQGVNAARLKEAMDHIQA